MSVKTASACLFTVIVSLVLLTDTEAAILTVHYPQDRTIMEFDLLNVALELPETSADRITITSNNGVHREIVPASRNVCFSLFLEPGMNNIEITAYKQEKIMDTAVIGVFRRSDLVSAYRTPPPGFRKSSFHRKDNEVCGKCHALKPTEYDRTPLKRIRLEKSLNEDMIRQEKSTCYSCHKSITRYSYVHGPASVWSCLSCHDPEAAPRYKVKVPDTEFCFSCHKEQKNRWYTKKYIHGPVNMGKCTICHNPHAGDYPYHLDRATWDLCTTCHFDNRTGMHVLGDSFSKEGHPTRGKPDPIRKGKELSCASCHNPHASDFPHLWQFEVESLLELCQKCHGDKKIR